MASAVRLEPSVPGSTLKRVMRGAALPRIRVYDPRHTTATVLLVAGVHPKVVQDLLGHRTIVVTMDTYSHVMLALHLQAVQTLNSLLASPPSRVIARRAWLRRPLHDPRTACMLGLEVLAAGPSTGKPRAGCRHTSCSCSPTGKAAGGYPATTTHYTRPNDPTQRRTREGHHHGGAPVRSAGLPWHRPGADHQGVGVSARIVLLPLSGRQGAARHRGGSRCSRPGRPSDFHRCQRVPFRPSRHRPSCRPRQILAAVLGGSGRGAAAPRSIKPAEVAQDLANLQLIDVREPEEWKSGHIAGAVHIPLGRLEHSIASVYR